MITIPELIETIKSYIDRIIDIVETLEKGGYAYAVKPNDEAEGMDVYYSTRAFKGYGQLSHQSVDDLMQGASERTYIDDIKKDPLDFALWKAAKPGENGKRSNLKSDK